MKLTVKSVKDLILFLKAEPLFMLDIFRLLKQPDKRIVLMGTPVHGNLGDHLIAEAEKQFFKENLPDYDVLELSLPFSKRFLNFINRHTNGNNLIMISGGGWLGTEWRHNEEYVRRILTEFNGACMTKTKGAHPFFVILLKSTMR